MTGLAWIAWEGRESDLPLYARTAIRGSVCAHKTSNCDATLPYQLSSPVYVTVIPRVLRGFTGQTDGQLDRPMYV